jgi:hypothetical protein
VEQNSEGKGEMGGGLMHDPTSYLKARDLDLRPEDEEESDLPEDFWSRTELSCSSCEEYIHFDEEVVSIIISQAQRVERPDEETGELRTVVEIYPVLGDDEDYAYEPLLIHFDCWDDICEEYHELIADEPKIRSRTPAADLFKCSFCNDGIGPWKEFAHVTIGEIAISDKRGQIAFKEAEGGSPEPVCLSCMDRIHGQCIELWKS